MKKELKRQFQFRQLYIDDLLEIKNSFEGDTIILKETYDYICFGCPADYVEIFTDSLVFTYRLKDENYSRTEESISESYYTGNGLFQGDISEIMNDIKKEQEWNKYASKYGTEECLDGGHTIYTIFINNDKTESMYMRCWVNKAMRKEK